MLDADADAALAERVRYGEVFEWTIDLDLSTVAVSYEQPSGEYYNLYMRDALPFEDQAGSIPTPPLSD